MGRSPLTRGRPIVGAVDLHEQRSIPAHAGETGHQVIKPAQVMVDPRSRGGDRNGRRLWHPFGGRSPLTRGRPLRLAVKCNLNGSIPAHAGETR